MKFVAVGHRLDFVDDDEGKDEGHEGPAPPLGLLFEINLICPQLVLFLLSCFVVPPFLLFLLLLCLFQENTFW